MQNYEKEYLISIISKCLELSYTNKRKTIMINDIALMTKWFPKPNKITTNITEIRKLMKREGCNRVSREALYFFRNYLNDKKFF